MATMTKKIGRPRRYDLRPVPGFANDEVGYFVAALDELLARVVDQVEDLSDAQVQRVVEGAALSVGALLVHLAWAEASWISTITGQSVPDDLNQVLQPAGSALSDGVAAPVTLSTAELVALCREVRQHYTLPALRSLSDLDAVIGNDRRPITPRGVLIHLIWHWTYHSAHIGLLRDFLGAGYAWTFGPLGITGEGEP